MLTEHDARAIATAIVRELRLLGAFVRTFLVQKHGDGLMFMANVNGRVVFAHTPPGTVPYRTVAVDILAQSLAPAQEH